MTVSCADLLAKVVVCHIPDREDSEYGETFTVKRLLGGDRDLMLAKSQEKVERTKMMTLLCGKLQNPVLTC